MGKQARRIGTTMPATGRRALHSGVAKYVELDQEAETVASVPPARRILGTRVDATSYQSAGAEILRWGGRGESRYVCVATVNNVIEAYDHPSYHRVMEDADLVTPDGMPLVWGLRLLGVEEATQVRGAELTRILCERAAALGIPVGFYGSEAAVLDDLTVNLVRRYPTLRVAYSYSPPFRPLTSDEDAQVVDAINRSGARLLFVGLGAPKQEQWMAVHKGRVQAVMLGVGAAFDFLAGRKRQAPRVLQRLGLEWLFRLVNEPRRLWRRYLYGNPRFVVLFLLQLIGRRSAHLQPAAESQSRDARPHRDQRR
jgi:N-acetylglucosaminyldiphosphoundecaprenol N-acetyl-beta-D-mannosaminyltransferase